METTKIALFEGKKIRKIIHNNEWWFSVVDVVEALTGSSNPNDYWFKMKIRVKDEDDFEHACQTIQVQHHEQRHFLLIFEIQLDNTGQMNKLMICRMKLQD